MTPAQTKVTSMIAAIRRRWLGMQLGLLATLALAGLLAWLLAMAVLDNFLIFGRVEFLAGWAVLVLAGAAWTGAMAYRMSLGQPQPRKLALLYESRVPKQKNRLVNAVDFLQTGEAERNVMAQAAVEENAARLDPQTVRNAVDLRPLLHALAAAGIAALLLLLYSAARPAMVGNALARLFNPLHPSPHLLETPIRVTPGDVDLIEGQPLVITATVAYNLPRDATLEYRVGELGWTKATMTPTKRSSVLHGGSSGTAEKTSDPVAAPGVGPGALAGAPPSPSAAGTAPGVSFTYNDFKAVWQPIRYRVAAGRSTSPVYSVTVQPRPRVGALQATVTLPGYTGGARIDLKPNTGDISALVGSTVLLALTATAPLSGGQLELSDGTRIPLAVGAGGGADAYKATAKFTLAQSGSYAIRLTDARGLTNINPPRYSLTAIEDQPPVAMVTHPGRDLILPAKVHLEIGIEAEDDYGLASVTLQVREPQGDWKDWQRWDIPDLKTRRQEFSTTLAMDQFKLKVNDSLLYRAMASDHRRPEPNVFIGRTWSITLAEDDAAASLLTAETKRLLDALSAILALQKENRGELDMDRPEDPLRARQRQVREMTLALIDQQHKSLRPQQAIIDGLTELADGPMVKANQLLADYTGTYQQRQPKKAPILAVMDQIIAKLEEMVGKVGRQLALAEKGQESLEKLSLQDREQALKQVRDTLEKLRKFIAEQDKAIADTEELVRKAPNFNAQDLQKMDQLKGTEDKWAEIFKGSVQDINKLTEQGLADKTMTSDYKQMVEAIEAAAKNLNPKLITMAVKREDAGREMAKTLAEDMEMWLPSTPDNIKWVMEEPLDKPEIPMVKLPENLSDLIGDLIAQEDKLTEEADDVTSAWADSIPAAGWGVSDGPISNFSAVGKTGNQLPNNNELSGRAGDGRSGKSEGQMVGDTARGLEGRKTPARVTNDPYEEGVVKELQQMATGGATGGGKARGSGDKGLQGQTPPPLMDKMEYMTDWQGRIRQKAEQVAGQLKSVHISELNKAIGLMKDAEKAGKDGRYADMFKTQQMVLQQLRLAGDLSARDTALRVDHAYNLPPDQRREILDAMDEPVPQEYNDAVRRYFEHLSESK